MIWLENTNFHPIHRWLTHQSGMHAANTLNNKLNFPGWQHKDRKIKKLCPWLVACPWLFHFAWRSFRWFTFIHSKVPGRTAPILPSLSTDVSPENGDAEETQKCLLSSHKPLMYVSLVSFQLNQLLACPKNNGCWNVPKLSFYHVLVWWWNWTSMCQTQENSYLLNCLPTQTIYRKETQIEINKFPALQYYSANNPLPPADRCFAHWDTLQRLSWRSVGIHLIISPIPGRVVRTGQTIPSSHHQES